MAFDTHNAVKKNSLEAAMGRMMQRHIDEGAVVHAGQFGSTICQYPDHYTEVCGLGGATNPGRWQPRKISDSIPTEPGILGELRCDNKGIDRWVFSVDGWIESPWLPDILSAIKNHRAET